MLIGKRISSINFRIIASEPNDTIINICNVSNHIMIHVHTLKYIVKTLKLAISNIFENDYKTLKKHEKELHNDGSNIKS